MPVTKAKSSAVAAALMVIALERAPKKKATDRRYKQAARQLELRRATANRKYLADDGEASEHQYNGEPHVRYC
jgi:hypothetical protein